MFRSTRTKPLNPKYPLKGFRVLPVEVKSRGSYFAKTEKELKRGRAIDCESTGTTNVAKRRTVATLVEQGGENGAS